MPYRLTPKSQVTIPRRVRQVLGIGPGDAIEFDVTAEGQVVIKAVGQAAVRPVDQVEEAPDRFARARGRLSTSLSTAQLMALLRPAD